jgi:branched-subunit amino acid aminotransferase/4-amino-4-deoxychorismate lyase
MQLWHNGALLEDREAHISATSAGLLLGWGAFTTLGIFRGQPFLLDKHLARLRRDCLALGLELSWQDSDLHAALESVLNANVVQAGMARITVTARGDGRWNINVGSDITILARAGEPDLHPATLWLSPFRIGESGGLAGVKSSSYAAHLRAWHDAKSHGCDDALLLTENGQVCEASRANIFWVKDGELFTPSLACGCLPGIAREWVIDRFKVREGVFSLEDLQHADKCL